MNAKRPKHERTDDLETVRDDLKLSELLQVRSTDGVAEAFSRDFEQNLKRILGDRYREDPEGGE